MVHTRETRPLAAEIKFLIDPSLAPAIRQWARQRLGPDPHGAGPAGDEYDIASIYFDTPDFAVLRREGSFGRAKFRVRRYGQDDVVFLERKLRRPGLLIKRRTAAPLHTLACLRDDESGLWGGEWFGRRLLARQLQPVCQVSYRRMARMAQAAGGPLRLTLDSDLEAVPVQAPEFITAGAGARPFFADRLIMELKYRERLPALFRQLVEEFALQACPASKYRSGMAALGYTGLPDAQPSAPGARLHV
jgi:hypothetical protein